MANFEEGARKSMQITLPCNAGQAVFYVNTIAKIIFAGSISEFCITEEGIFAILDDEYKGVKRKRIRGVPLSAFGDTLFFTREEAEVALARKAVGK